MSETRQRLAALLTERSVKLGDFTLASGARSSYYIDARLTTMSAEGQHLVGRVALGAIRDAGWDPEWVGGLTLGADPVAYAIAHRSFHEGPSIDAFTVRKTPKDHGTGRQIEGGLPAGARVVLLEDSVTSGGSALKAAEVVVAHGADVLGVLALVDREEGGRAAIEGAGYPFITVFRAADLVRGAGAVTGTADA